MESIGRLDGLARSIKEDVDKLSEFFVSSGHPVPSFDQDAVTFPSNVDIAKLLLFFLWATRELHFRLLGPRALLLQQSQVS